MTFGTLGAMIAADGIMGRANPWAELFDPGRKKIRHAAWDYVTENKDYPYYLVRDRFAGAEGRTLRSVKRGEGKILDLKGSRVGLPERGRDARRPLRGLHAYGMRGDVEHRRAHVGLSVPWFAVQADGRGAGRPRGGSARKDRPLTRNACTDSARGH